MLRWIGAGEVRMMRKMIALVAVVFALQLFGFQPIPDDTNGTPPQLPNLSPNEMARLIYHMKNACGVDRPEDMLKSTPGSADSPDLKQKLLDDAGQALGGTH